MTGTKPSCPRCDSVFADINAAMEIVPMAGAKSLTEAVQHWAGQLDKARDDWRQMKAERDAAVKRAEKALSDLRWIVGATKEAIIRDAALKALANPADAKEGTPS